MSAETPSNQLNIDAQTKSLLFQLPSEIRNQILTLFVYEGAASQHVVHFEGKRGFVRLPCRAIQDEDISFRNQLEWYCLSKSPWRDGHLNCYRALHSQHSHTVDRLSSPLSLLLTCRRMHGETADVLYKDLSFVGLKPLRRFLRRRKVEYLERIRTISIQWEGIVRSLGTLNLDFEDWAPTCDRIAKLPCLRFLRVKIFVCDRTSSRSAELFLRPLQAMKDIRVVAEVVRNCWDYHPSHQPKITTAIKLGEYEIPVRVCGISLQNRWRVDHVVV